MSLFDVTLIVSYFILFICTGVLCLGDVQKRITRENFLDDQRSHQNKWEAKQSPFIVDTAQLKEGWTLVKNWPKASIKLGQVSGVSIDSKGLVYIFHRGDRVWGSNTFDLQNIITESERRRGPIPVSTVIVYHPDSGEILQKWGENMFYIPHGITIDRDDNVWTTDVALHQVFKYPPLKNNPGTAHVTLGEAFVPGNDAVHFCKPTSIAVTPWGDFFVADGYCNSRIMKFGENGVKISEWGRSSVQHGIIGQPPNYMFNVPHGLALAEDKGLLCVADREDGRIQCFDWRNDTFVLSLHSSHIGSRLFSVAYAPVHDGLFFAVNGLEMKQFPVSVGGYVFSGQNHKDMFQFGVNTLKNPHDIAVSPDGKTVFVVEIGPFTVWKFQSNDVINSYLSESNKNSSVSSVFPSDSVARATAPQQNELPLSPSGILPAILVTSAALIFAGALLSAALVYSRAKRRGRSIEEITFDMETKKLVSSEY